MIFPNGTDAGVTVNQFMEFCKEVGREQGIEWGNDESLKFSILEYFNIPERSSQLIFTDDAWASALDILQKDLSNPTTSTRTK